MSMSRSLSTLRFTRPHETGDGGGARSPRPPWRNTLAFGLGLALLLQGIGGGAAKLASGRSDDLAHTALHVVSGLAGLVASRRRTHAAARTFLAVFGLFYLALAVLGWSGSAVAAWLRLAPADHIFHTLVGAMSATAALWPGRVAAGEAGAGR